MDSLTKGNRASVNTEINTTTLSPVESYPIPTFQNGSGLIHTVVCGRNGIIYFSDEINHAVAAVNSEGTVHWVTEGKGKEPGRFHYPRGLALGKTLFGDNNSDCLAVCDSWNHRVQFFNLEGDFLGEWVRAGEEKFDEPSDVRFMHSPGDFSSGGETGSWLVLDKGNHCLYVLGTDGTLQSRLGRPLPHTLQNRWTLPEIRFEKGFPVPGTIDEAKPLDFLFFPERFLGEKNGTFYILDSNFYGFKQWIGKLFLPIHIQAEQDMEWISLDPSFLVGWNRTSNCLLLQNHSGTKSRQASIQGIPIPSNAELTGIFIQNEDALEKRVWTDVISSVPANETEKTDNLMIRSAQTEFHSLDIVRIRELLESFLSHVDALIKDADIILSLGIKDPDKELLQSTEKHLQSTRIWRQKHFQSINEALNPLCLGILESHLLGIPVAELAGNFPHLTIGWNRLEDMIRNKYASARKGFDEICEMHLRRNIPDSHSPDYVEAWNHIVANAQFDMDDSLAFLKRCLFTKELETILNASHGEFS